MALNRPILPTAEGVAQQDDSVSSVDGTFQLLPQRESTHSNSAVLGMARSTLANYTPCRRSSPETATDYTLSDFGPQSFFRYLRALADTPLAISHGFDCHPFKTVIASEARSDSRGPDVDHQTPAVTDRTSHVDATHSEKGKSESHGQAQVVGWPGLSSFINHAAPADGLFGMRSANPKPEVHPSTSILNESSHAEEIGSSEAPESASRAEIFERYTDDRRRRSRSQIAHDETEDSRVHDQWQSLSEDELAQLRRAAATRAWLQAEAFAANNSTKLDRPGDDPNERDNITALTASVEPGSSTSASDDLLGPDYNWSTPFLERLNREFGPAGLSLSSFNLPSSVPGDNMDLDVDADEDEEPVDDVSSLTDSDIFENRRENLRIHPAISHSYRASDIQVNKTDDDEHAIAKRRVFTEYQNIVSEDVQKHYLETFLRHKESQSEPRDAPSQTDDATSPTQYSKNLAEMPPKSRSSWSTPGGRIIPPKRSDPPQLEPPATPRQGFPPEFWDYIPAYLSSTEIRALRLVNKKTAHELAPYVFRSLVVNFGPHMFDGNGKDDNRRPHTLPPDSLLRKFGAQINKFGISFDFDQLGLAYAPSKEIQESVVSWFGNYTWPIDNYPRFKKIQTQEDLVDTNSKLLKEGIECLSNASELGLSVDSGHGWLSGMDISDLALWKQRHQAGPEVFGPAFGASDKAVEYALRVYFRWAQMNSLEATAKVLAHNHDPELRDVKADLERMKIQEYDEYLCQHQQPGHHINSHVGQTTDRRPWPVRSVNGTFDFNPVPHDPVTATRSRAADVNANRLAFISNADRVAFGSNANGVALHSNANRAAFNSNGNIQPGPFNGRQTPGTSSIRSQSHPDSSRQPNGHSSFIGVPNPLASASNLMSRALARARLELDITNTLRGIASEMKEDTRSKKRLKVRRQLIPQWPIIFNCQNLTAYIGGTGQHIQRKVARPADSPLLPGILREAQAQWLMETLWAQRTFMAAYTNSVITSKDTLKNVHSLHIARISGNLLSMLEQEEFWTSLRNLRSVTLMVIPDWRQEHVPGDKCFVTNMPVNPVESSVKLAHILKAFIAPLENLCSLTTGFVGGGEHACGMFARNSHVLPAPITKDSRSWLTHESQGTKVSPVIIFNHVRELTFKNCWFTPLMLENFLHASRDTSLHHLTLDSVSLTGQHNSRDAGPMTWAKDKAALKCAHLPEEWVFETVTSDHCWVNVLENVTPGRTMFDYKCETGVISDPVVIEEHGPRGFRGHTESITLKSCGYVEISGIDPTDFAQHGLIRQGREQRAFDNGLRARLISFKIDNRMLIASGSDYNARTDNAAMERPFMENPQEAFDFINGGSDHRSVMMVPRDLRTGKFFCGLGKLTSCVHPVEQRVLEQGWGMTFGWGDSMERWAAVEDGHCEGGTGRFSGVVTRPS